MHVSLSLLCLGIWTLAVFGNKMLDECLLRNPKYTMNVVVLEDNTYAWSRPFVQKAVEDAIEEDRQENDKHGTERRFLLDPTLFTLKDKNKPIQIQIQIQSNPIQSIQMFSVLDILLSF